MALDSPASPTRVVGPATEQKAGIERLPEPSVRQILDDLKALEEEVRRYAGRIEEADSCDDLLVQGAAVVDHLRRITHFFLREHLRRELATLAQGDQGTSPSDDRQARHTAARQTRYLYSIR